MISLSESLNVIAPTFNELAPTRHGPMLYHANDRYIGASLRKYGEFSPGEGRLFAQILRPGDVVVEAGANFGAHTVHLSRLVGNEGAVFAFEPQRLVFQCLCANLAINGLSNVQAIHAALGSRRGALLVPVIIPDADSYSYGSYSALDHDEGEPVQMHTIDTLGLGRCSMLKVDVEGMETDVLRGASALIRKTRPVLYVENDRFEWSEELLNLMFGWRYDLWWHLPSLFYTDNYNGDTEDIFPGVVSLNVLGVPTERKLDLDFGDDYGRKIESSRDWWDIARHAA